MPSPMNACCVVGIAWPRQGDVGVCAGIEGFERSQIQALLSGLMDEVECVGNLPPICTLSIRKRIFSMA